MPLYQILSMPWAFRAAQVLAAPGSHRSLNRAIKKVLEGIDSDSAGLDVGCGPRSWLENLAPELIGVDLSFSYVNAMRRRGTPGIVATADTLPFADGAFRMSFSLGLLHHLPDAVARVVVSEMRRVTDERGKIVVIDAVLPERRSRIIARALRHLDRGRYIRTEAHHLDVLGADAIDESRRITYSVTGLEAVVTTLRARALGQSSSPGPQ